MKRFFLGLFLSLLVLGFQNCSNPTLSRIVDSNNSESPRGIQIGSKSTSPPKLAPGSPGTYMLRSSGDVYFWGYNDPYHPDSPLTQHFQLFPDISSAVDISGRSGRTCVVLQDTTVKCWTYSTSETHTDPATVPDLVGAVEVATGDLSSCARLQDGTVKCWGDNSYGELGRGSIGGFNLPVDEVVNLTNVSQITCIGSGYCARLQDGTVKCWGYNNQGSLGNGTLANSGVPVSVQNLTDVVQVAGVGRVKALLGDGTVKTWGGSSRDWDVYNPYEIIPMITTPILVRGLENVRRLADQCALIQDGTVKCWGYNQAGELGLGYISAFSDPILRTPTTVPNLSGVVDIAGGATVCATLSDDTLKCWGLNAHGQVGDDTKLNRDHPVKVIMPSDFEF